MDAAARLPRLMARTALAGCVVMAAIILTSAYLRLTTIGIGCAQWPQCYGRAAGIGSAAADPSAAVKAARLAHRVAAMAAALVVAFVVLLACTRALRDAVNAVVAAALAVAIVVLSVVGRQTAGTLVPLIGVVNLVGGFGMLALFWLLFRHNGAPAPGAPGARTWLAGALAALVLVQSAVGALVSVTYSASACRGVLDCGTRLGAAHRALGELHLMRPLALDASNRVRAPEGAAELQLVHRLCGLALGSALVLLGAWLARDRARRPLGLALALAAAAEMGLGIAMVSGGFPLPAALLHNVTAALLLLVTLAFVHHVHTRAST